ncbi:hypothetical protein [Lysobacter gummosus]|uniref:hypothetical protein n=1 Tax=Lysobacter gummosus TaxID=262324 RepID=UPI0036367F4C
MWEPASSGHGWHRWRPASRVARRVGTATPRTLAPAPSLGPERLPERRDRRWIEPEYGVAPTPVQSAPPVAAQTDSRSRGQSLPAPPPKPARPAPAAHRREPVSPRETSIRQASRSTVHPVLTTPGLTTLPAVFILAAPNTTATPNS